MQTALVLRIPEAEAAIAHWRARHDPAAADGMPAHVTLISPFKPSSEIDAEAEASLAYVFAQSAPVDLHFAETRRFPSVLWLAPDRAEPVVGLVRALRLAFPDHLPYGGAHAEVVPHLTVAHLSADASPEDLDRIEKEFLADARPRLPIRARIEAASLFCKDEDGWREKRRFDFGRKEKG
ncbi:2'-5' RNA ligase family protein [Parvibaculum sp.]|uniref:2'-5' RNA ligase family protein n=1 Tax=Parvibaculum sp. TaxID=2024848 RepID=UPI002C89663B|nr:2'-5' RNA ligase family protein [Parvibaculum sp.]HUD52009.1 2'-5' RNA ligase family protein [Parvibaculum sp.]